MFRCECYVCEAEIGCEDDDEEEEVDPGRGIDSREEEFEEGEGGIETVLGEVGPQCEGGGEGGVED